MKSNVGHSFDRYFKYPHLYLEDLQDIENILKNDLNSGRYGVRTIKYGYDKVDEIVAEHKTLNELYITSLSPNISVNFSPDYAKVYSNDHPLNVVGAAEKISTIIQRRERKLAWFIYEKSEYLFYPAIIISMIGIFSNRELLIVGLLLGFFGLVISLMRLNSVFKVSVIEFRKFADRKTFFDRNKDKISVNLISNSIMLIIGALLGYFGRTLSELIKWP